MEKNISNVQELLIKLNEIKVILEIGTNDRIGYENYNYVNHCAGNGFVLRLSGNQHG